VGYSAEVDAVELGRRLRAERTASGRTIASVAADAGLSVPYIANLENGRGNPTVAALTRLAEALGLRLDVDLASGEPEPPATPTGEILRFARTERFGADATRLAERSDTPELLVRQRLLTMLATAERASGQQLTTMDCHRFLDALLLATSHP
jgi:transcriptional regulator with XRE-family HTH domain